MSPDRVRTLAATSLVVAVLVADRSAQAQSEAVAAPQPIRLDVVATEPGGRVVPDLRRGEFEVVEGDTIRPVEDVRFVPASAPRTGAAAETLPPIATRSDEQDAAAGDGVRLFGIFLDEYHVTAGPGAERARDDLARLVRGLGPRDLVAVFRPLDSILTIRMTRDREAAARAVEAFDPRKGSFEARNAFEQYFIGGGQGRIEAARAQIATSAMSALAAHLGGLGGGPKTLIVLSEGFERGPRRRGDDLPTLGRIVRMAARASVAIYAMDPRAWDPLPPVLFSSADSATDTTETPGDSRRVLVELGGETNGAAILQPSDLAAVWPRLTAEAPGHYVLTFRGAEDGQYHPVSVRVLRRGVQTRTRSGYWAESAADRVAAALLSESRAPRPPAEPVRRSSPLIRPWFGLTRGADGRTRVQFVWEPTPRVPGVRSRAQPPVRVTMKATQADGTAVFEGVVGAATPSAAATLAGEPVQAVFDAAPGRLLVQMTIENAVAQVLDIDVRDLPVSALNAPVVLGTPQVWRARNAREFRALQEHPETAPIAAREFSRTERLLIRVPAFGPGVPAVSARLLSRMGVPMRDLPIASGEDRHLRQIDLPLAGFAVGEYVIEFAARGADRDVREAVRFRVVP